MSTVREIIEAKLENGVQTFSAHEVALLLNQIRILEAGINIEKVKGLLSVYKESKK